MNLLQYRSTTYGNPIIKYSCVRRNPVSCTISGVFIGVLSDEAMSRAYVLGIE